jgi:hypothetical protein
MTEPQFQNLYDEVFGAIPQYAKDCILGYANVQNIHPEILINDEPVNLAEKKKHIDAPAGLLLATDTNWHFAFRPYILNAPRDVLSTIIRHEFIHGFLISAEKLPMPAAKSALEKYNKQIEQTCAMGGIPVPQSIEEDLVCLINDDWGGNEMKAKEWVRQNKRKKA